MNPDRPDSSRGLPSSPALDDELASVIAQFAGAGPDAELSIVRRDGKVVNASITRNLRKDIERGRQGEPRRDKLVE